MSDGKRWKRPRRIVAGMVSVTVVTIGALLYAQGGRPALPQLPAPGMPAAGLPGGGVGAGGANEQNVDRAVANGIRFLVTKQDNRGAITEGGVPTAMTSLAIMAMAAVGHQPTDDTPEGRAMSKALTFVLRDGAQLRDPNNRNTFGYFGNDGSNMYGHGITTLMLAEMLGMGVDDKQDTMIRDRLGKAVDLILRAQKARNKIPQFAGGWRYSPEAPDADLSVTVWQVMALRAAKNAGMDVPKEAIDKAIAYIKRSYVSPRDAQGKPTRPGPFGYQLANGAQYATACEGLLALQVCGEYDAPEVIGAADWIAANRPPRNQQFPWFYYGSYYYAQGMYQRGGKYADDAARITAETLLPLQKPNLNGAWPQIGNEGQGGMVYSTSMAILSLSVKYHFLPIYQR